MADLNYGVMEGTLKEIRENVLFIDIDNKTFPIWFNGNLTDFSKGDSLKLKVHIDVGGDFNLKIIADEVTGQLF